MCLIHADHQVTVDAAAVADSRPGGRARRSSSAPLQVEVLGAEGRSLLMLRAWTFQPTDPVHTGTPRPPQPDSDKPAKLRNNGVAEVTCHPKPIEQKRDV